jgi:hypothetical protein
LRRFVEHLACAMALRCAKWLQVVRL